MTDFWTDQRVADLKEYLALRLSSRVIANAIGAHSAAAVRAKMKRLGLTGISKTHKPQNIGFGLGYVGEPKAPQHLEVGAADRADGYRIIDPEFKGCRWPIGGEGAETRHCCRPRAVGSYCAEHHARSRNVNQPAPASIKGIARLIRRAA